MSLPVDEQFFDSSAYYMKDIAEEANLRRGALLGHPGVAIAVGAIVRTRCTIGENTFIGQYSYVNDEVEIGKNVLIGPSCSLTSSNHKFNPETQSFSLRTVSQKVVIGDGSWLASHVVVTNGVHIGKANLICAGAVVTKSTPDYAIMAGVPAKQIGEIDAVTGEYRYFSK